MYCVDDVYSSKLYLMHTRSEKHWIQPPTTSKFNFASFPDPLPCGLSPQPSAVQGDWLIWPHKWPSPRHGQCFMNTWNSPGNKISPHIDYSDSTTQTPPRHQQTCNSEPQPSIHTRYVIPPTHCYPLTPHWWLHILNHPLIPVATFNMFILCQILFQLFVPQTHSLLSSVLLFHESTTRKSYHLLQQTPFCDSSGSKSILSSMDLAYP